MNHQQRDDKDQVKLRGLIRKSVPQILDDISSKKDLFISEKHAQMVGDYGHAQEYNIANEMFVNEGGKRYVVSYRIYIQGFYVGPSPSGEEEHEQPAEGC